MTPTLARADLWRPGPRVLDLHVHAGRRDVPGGEVGGNLRDGFHEDHGPPCAAILLLRELDEDELRRRLESGAIRQLESLAASPEAWPSLKDQAFDRRRGAWQVLCPLTTESVVCDLDAGFGAITRTLAGEAGFVIGIDDVRSRLLVSEALNREQGVHNVRLACGDLQVIESWSTDCLDGVWLGRRLERVGEPGPVGHEGRVEVLRHVRRTLRTGGWLALAARNGRQLEGLLRERRSSDAGVAAWIALLTEIGFEDVQVYAAAPDIDHCHTLVPWPDGDVAAVLHACGVRKRWKLALLASPILRPYVARDLLIVARNGRDARPHCLRPAEGSALRKIYLSAAKASLWYRDSGGDHIRDVPLDRAAAESLARIDAIAAAWRGRGDTPVFLTGRRIRNGGGRTWVNRRMVNGTPLAELPGITQPQIDAVCRRLHSFAEVGAEVALPVLTRRDVVDHFLDANANSRARIDPAFAHRLRRVADALTERDPGGWPLLMHGDFTPNNVLLAGHAAEPIDWDLATPVDFRGYDLLNLLWYRYCGPNPEPGVWTRIVEQCSVGQVDPTAEAWIGNACGDADPVSAVATFWLLRLARGAAFGEAWVDAHALPSLARAEAWLQVPS